jgi:hypothetical protein
MKNRIEIYLGNKIVAEGQPQWKESIIAYARAKYPKEHLVAQGYRENGSCYGFIVSKAPPEMGM